VLSFLSLLCQKVDNMLAGHITLKKVRRKREGAEFSSGLSGGEGRERKFLGDSGGLFRPMSRHPNCIGGKKGGTTSKRSFVMDPARGKKGTGVWRKERKKRCAILPPRRPVAKKGGEKKDGTARFFRLLRRNHGRAFRSYPGAERSDVRRSFSVKKESCCSTR